jgi:hypothetical protein
LVPNSFLFCFCFQFFFLRSNCWAHSSPVLGKDESKRLRVGAPLHSTSLHRYQSTSFSTLKVRKKQSHTHNCKDRFSLWLPSTWQLVQREEHALVLLLRTDHSWHSIQFQCSVRNKEWGGILLLKSKKEYLKVVIEWSCSCGFS